MAQHVDVVVVGAGLSGISQGYHLQTRCPDRRYLILEAREAIGGTWDLFRYPGVRSDSDMHTLGFGFRPWQGAKAIADGAAIRDYIAETARAHGIDRHIRFGVTVRRAAWSSEEARWTIEADGPDGPLVLTCDVLSLCAGYYDYTQGHAPDFPHAEDFGGRIVHPQFWPQDLDISGRRVVVIGSGATAMTLVPELAKTAAHVTMLQRSPTFVVAQPSRDRVADTLRRLLPGRLAYRLTRWKNVAAASIVFALARRYPEGTRRRLLSLVRRQLGADYDVGRHFSPRYKPWDQRICLLPDGDLFAAIRDGRAAVVTDTIDRFVPEGVRLASGETLAADCVVTATGLRIRLLGGIALSVDGRPVPLSERMLYRGMMIEGVPNLALFFGYTNASWTLKADLTAAYLCRLLNVLRDRGLRTATPVSRDPAMTREPFLHFTSGYVRRADDILPKQGSRGPWRLSQNYPRDAIAMRYGAIDEDMILA